MRVLIYPPKSALWLTYPVFGRLGRFFLIFRLANDLPSKGNERPIPGLIIRVVLLVDRLPMSSIYPGFEIRVDYVLELSDAAPARRALPSGSHETRTNAI